MYNCNLFKKKNVAEQTTHQQNERASDGYDISLASGIGIRNGMEWKCIFVVLFSSLIELNESTK